MLGKQANINVGNFEALPEDKYVVQIVDVNFKTEFNSFKGMQEEKLNFRFAVLSDAPMGTAGKESTRGRFLWKSLTQSLGNTAHLSKLAVAALGRPLTEAEMTKDDPEFFNPEDLLGKQLSVLVNKKEGKGNSAGRFFNNVISFSALAEGAYLEPVEFEAKVEEVVKTATRTIEEPETVMDVPNAINPFEDSADEIANTGKEVEAEENDAEMEKLQKAAEESKARLDALKAKKAKK